MAAVTRVLVYLATLLLCLALAQATSVTKRRAGYFEALNELAEKEEPVSRTDDLILRFLDALVAHEESRGTSPEEMHNLMRKRAGIQRCFFHAVNCW